MENSTCLLFPLEPQKCTTIVTIKRVNATFSIAFCILMLFMIWLFKFYKLFVYRLITYLTIATLFDCIIYLLGEPQEDSATCLFEGFWLTYSDWNVVLWIVFITIYLFLVTVKSIKTDRFEWVYVVTGFLLPVLPASLPFAGSAYGPAGAWCWITDTAWRMAVWFVPVLLLLLAILTVYIIILTRIRRRTTTWSGMYGEESAAAVATAAVQLQEQLYPLLAYPCIFLALNLLPFVNRINNAASAEPSFVLYLLSAVSSPLIGTINFILFYVNPAVRKKVTRLAILQRLRTGGRQTESVVQEYNADGDGGQGGGMMDIATSTLTFSRFQNEAVDDQSQLQQPPLQHRLAEGEEQRASSVGLRPATDRY
ncbi:hypothetical protein BOX15_Mlig013741g5 [Macrostomum lignano]|uniref:Uncharacterized protein n=2 Tax=Macrostomum lignano TaxID=282301 RepID=A0A267ENY3_9PLAT|nr:hypothetical protein BOX15_Mlig013741g3 [Macrostomum lignano]PAA70933.1 hypothetical protein BOX15_Mlig013741g1 [Macrostomum lignano]PAA82731.1 hypothetical protein BOX15_Mlig013741g5 [Macrostomum lignano]